jgi:hypothetical protein
VALRRDEAQGVEGDGVSDEGEGRRVALLPPSLAVLADVQPPGEAAARRLMDDAEGGLAVDDEADVDRPRVLEAGIFRGPVDRIDEPAAAGRLTLSVELARLSSATTTSLGKASRSAATILALSSVSARVTRPWFAPLSRISRAERP